MYLEVLSVVTLVNIQVALYGNNHVQWFIKPVYVVTGTNLCLLKQRI